MDVAKTLLLLLLRCWRASLAYRAVRGWYRFSAAAAVPLYHCTTVPLVQLLSSSCAVRQKSALESRQREKMTASANARVGTKNISGLKAILRNIGHRGGCAVSTDIYNLKEANGCNTTSTMWTTIREGSFEAGMVPHIWSSRWSRENNF